jgi:hypothetical protein
MKSYYECKRCFHKFSQKSDIEKHLDRKYICKRILESYNYDEKNLYELSLIKIKPEKIKIQFICDKCEKKFYNKFNLERHIENSCKGKKENKNTIIYNDFKEINEKQHNSINIENKNISLNFNDEEKIESNLKKNENIYDDNNTILNNNNITNSNITNSNINCNNNNIFNININIPRSFDEEWDVSNIDIKKKLVLFLNKTKFSKTLQEILENEVNLNVILDKDSSSGIVYKNNKLVNMNVKDIVNKSMDKLYKHLLDFYKELKVPNILNINDDILDYEKKIAGNKYYSYKNKNNKDTQTNVEQIISNLYYRNNKKAVKVQLNNKELNNEGF